MFTELLDIYIIKIITEAIAPVLKNERQLNKDWRPLFTATFCVMPLIFIGNTFVQIDALYSGWLAKYFTDWLYRTVKRDNVHPTPKRFDNGTETSQLSVVFRLRRREIQFENFTFAVTIWHKIVPGITISSSLFSKRMTSFRI